MAPNSLVISERNTGIWWLAGAGVAWWVYKKVIAPASKAVKAERYVARFRFNIIKVKLSGDNVDMDVYIQNPNSYPMVIKAIVGEVWINSSSTGRLKVGNVARYGTAVIQPVSETKFPIVVKLRFIQVLAYFNNLISGKMKNQVLQFTGTINIDNVPYPVNESYQLA